MVDKETFGRVKCEVGRPAHSANQIGRRVFSRFAVHRGTIDRREKVFFREKSNRTFAHSAVKKQCFLRLKRRATARKTRATFARSRNQRWGVLPSVRRGWSEDQLRQF